jgi:DNA-binding transcriptional regulator GbsR (MarR family)
MELCIKEFKKGTIRKLFEGENNFWKTVYFILKSESDPKKPDERNTIFEGHL